jgi:predicted AAA+ superfamily ATPase
LLEKACLLHKIKSVNPNGLPLAAEASDKYFKLQFLDIGLGQRWAGFSAAEVNSSNDLLGLYEGRLAEQFVGQQLLAESKIGSENRALYCWIRAEKNSAAGVDFILVRDGKIIGVEVKYGPSGKLKSLKMLRETYSTLRQSICLQQRGTIEEKNGVLFMPLYTIL